ncbi:MAG: hypothetical protein GY820_22590, partial [Gammaproteobacteria bacterium]|nr:hypothetical protein [Gammaproteobacteria bacterium]
MRTLVAGIVIICSVFVVEVFGADLTSIESYNNATNLFNLRPDGLEPNEINYVINELKKTIQMDSSLKKAYVLLARTYNQKSDLFEWDSPERKFWEGEAVKMYKKAIDLDPTDPMIQYRLAVQLGGNSPEQVAIVKRIVTEFPEFAPAHKSYAKYLEGRGEIGLAIDEYYKYIDIVSNGEGQIGKEMYIRMWKLLTVEGRKTEAIDLLTRNFNYERIHIVASTLSRIDYSSYTEDEYSEFVAKANKIINHKDKKNIVEAYRLLEEGRLAMAMEKFNKQISVNPYATRHYREF